MTTKRLSNIAMALGLLSLLSFFVLDRVLFDWTTSHRPWDVWSSGTHLLEVVFGFPLSKWATGLFLLLLALLLAPFAKTRTAARALAFVGAVELGTRLVAGVLKTVIPRARPFEILAGVDWHAQWFHSHGSSFPSGHAAHFWGLYFPLVALYPRLALPLLPLPLFISIARVAVNDHYLSDVTVSAAIAALLTLIAYSVYTVVRPSRRADANLETRNPEEPAALLPDPPGRVRNHFTSGDHGSRGVSIFDRGRSGRPQAQSG